MAAPTAAFIALARAGRLARHHAFYLAHPDGPVRLWDGKGDLTIAGVVYKGVGSLGTITGLSDSRDLQTHAVEVNLSQIPFSALADENLKTRGAAATITYAWLDIDGNVVASRIAFDGLANGVSVAPGETDHVVTLRLRNFISSWSAVPGAYYTPEDQNADYPNDTGFDQMRALVNAGAVGWGLAPGVSGNPVIFSRTTLYGTGTGILRVVPYDSATLDILGNSVIGPSWTFAGGATAPGHYFVTDASGARRYNDPTNDMFWRTADDHMVSGAAVSAYADASVNTTTGVVASSAGTNLSLAVVGGTVRRQGAITATGTATARQVAVHTTGGVGTLHADAGTVVNYNTQDQTRTVYDNAGQYFGVDDVTMPKLVADYAEATTGNAVSIVGGIMQVSGAACVISSTGVVLTSAGNRVLRKGTSGGTANNFLRIWT